MKPTDEQADALDQFLRGDSMVVEALAGTGKTSTLVLLAAATRERGRYIAFNKAIVQDVAGQLVERCPAATAHSLAFRAVGSRYRHRLNSPRMKSWQVARHLGVDPLVVVYAGTPKRLAAGFLAGHVMRALDNFCSSGDPEPTVRHFAYLDGIDPPGEAGRRTYGNNDAVAVELEGALRKAWLDMTKVDGVLPYRHGAYLKAWQLSAPTIETDYLLWDEAQDASPVMTAVIEAQDCQVVAVGDPNQAIYEWTGAINALDRFDREGGHRATLTGSFRFGPPIADMANMVLARLGADLRVRGLGGPSTVGALDDDVPVDALLCRTNAAALAALLREAEAGRRAALVGGGGEIASFARAAVQLQEKGETSHYELACFSSWREVLDYVRDDPAGSDLAGMVNIVEKVGAETVLRAVDGASPEGTGVLTVSTCHKAKGRQWPVVRIDADMVDVEPTPSELRLRYVAFTRAREHLDDSAFRKPVTEGKAARAPSSVL